MSCSGPREPPLPQQDGQQQTTGRDYGPRCADVKGLSHLVLVMFSARGQPPRTWVFTKHQLCAGTGLSTTHTHYTTLAPLPCLPPATLGQVCLHPHVIDEKPDTEMQTRVCCRLGSGDQTMTQNCVQGDFWGCQVGTRGGRASRGTACPSGPTGALELS